MTRLSYSLLWWFALPLVLGRLLWRSRTLPSYRAHLPQRLGLVAPRCDRPIWLHAVSVGETRAAQPLVWALRTAYPHRPLLLTQSTPTGQAAARELYGADPGISFAWCPWDLAGATARFAARVQPSMGIVMETEVWPNLIAAMRVHGVPLLLANARLSARSARGYTRLGSLARSAFGSFDAVAAQSRDSASRLTELGARGVQYVGNLKFDVAAPVVPDDLLVRWRAWIGTRPVLLAASTREGEEAALFAAFARLAPPEVLLVVVPRHPQRFDAVARLAQEAGLACARRSRETALEPGVRVWLGDSMGELAAYYALAEVAIIGGYWQPFGGHNLIEACAAGVPTLLGPHDFNFAEAATLAADCGAAERLPNLEAAVRRALQLCYDPAARARMSQAGRDFTQTHRGATERTLALIEQLIGEAARPRAPLTGSGSVLERPGA